MTVIPSKFYSLADREPIYDSLFEHSSPATIYRIGRTCRVALWAVKNYTARVFDIHRHLERFFVDPFGFRILQARTQAIISGSSALQFLNRALYPHSDLDIFVANRNAAEVCAWIVNHGGKGYQFVATERQARKGIDTPAIALRIHRQREYQTPQINENYSSWDFYDSSRYRAVLNFRASGGKNRTVQVIVTHNTPMECLLSFHSTVVMNLITHFAAYSLFPKGTFEEGLTLPCDTREVNREPGIRKYLARGWKLARSAVAPHSDARYPFVLGKRSVGDQLTWVVRFKDASEVLKYAKNHCQQKDPISLNTFSLMRSRIRGSVEMQFSILKPMFFVNRYTTCPENVPKMRFWFNIINKMEEAVGDCCYAEKFVEWDMILDKWNSVLIQECTCRPGIENFNFRVCPAFISSFVHFALLAKHRLALISNSDIDGQGMCHVSNFVTGSNMTLIM